MNRLSKEGPHCWRKTGRTKGERSGSVQVTAGTVGPAESPSRFVPDPGRPTFQPPLILDAIEMGFRAQEERFPCDGRRGHEPTFKFVFGQHLELAAGFDH